MQSHPHRSALILVDIQNDFVPGGALAVPQGNEIIPLVNQLQPCFDLVVATQDWHPANHGSFAANHPGRTPGEMITLHGLPQVMWPVHCVQGTFGAEFCAGLNTEAIRKVFQKGTNPDVDSYSGFFDNGQRQGTGLIEWLRAEGVTEVAVVGLATDYCVKFTALDALGQGLRTLVITDACRGVNLAPGDVETALQDLACAGARLVTTAEVLADRQASL